MTTITTAPIDFAYEEDTLTEGIAGIEGQFPGLKVDVVRTGGSGGWPEVTLTGEPIFIETVLRTAWDTNCDDENDRLVAFAFGDKDAFNR